jgi:hypothetical protein
MKLYYVRWPNGTRLTHTIAVARDKNDLWDLIDESADPGETLVMEIRRDRFAFDFTHQVCADGEDEYHEFDTVEGEYESLHALQIGCCELLDSELKSGAEFFKGCFDAQHPPGTSEEVLNAVAKQLGVTR